MGLGGQHNAPAALPGELTRYLLYRRLSGLGLGPKISPPLVFELLAVQPVVSSDTNRTIPAGVCVYELK
jgi:hypothetical protein